MIIMPPSVVEACYFLQVGYMTFNFQKNAKMLLLQQQKQLEKGEVGIKTPQGPPCLPDPLPSLPEPSSGHVTPFLPEPSFQ